MAFTIKTTRKSEGRGDYVISKLEGQYWPDDDNPGELDGRLLIRTPDFVGNENLKDAARKLIEKGEGVEIVSLSEGPCVQMLHVGPYEKEQETLDEMSAYAKSEGFELHGCHHEIYLSDPRRVSPEKLRTILRFPVTRTSPNR